MKIPYLRFIKGLEKSINNLNNKVISLYIKNAYWNNRKS